MKFSFLNPFITVAGYFILAVLAWSMAYFVSGFVGNVTSNEITPRTRQRRLLRRWLGLLASALCFALFFESMFLRFSCVVVDIDQVALLYFWPRQARVILARDLRDVRIESYPKGRAELVIVEEEESKSIVCTKTTDLNPVREAIAATIRSANSQK